MEQNSVKYTLYDTNKETTLSIHAYARYRNLAKKVGRRGAEQHLVSVTDLQNANHIYGRTYRIGVPIARQTV